MKLASLKDGRDGNLAVVSSDLSRAAYVPAIAPTMQAALDNWDDVEQKLRKAWDDLESGAVKSFAFHEEDCASPLPRAFQWADGSAYVNHVELVRKSRGVEMPESFWQEPLMYQGGSDSFLGPRDPIRMADEAWGIDFEGEVAVITGDVPMGVSPEEAGQYIRLIVLVNDVSLRNLVPGELAKGFGFFQSKPSSAFSPVAVTPDMLGKAWDGGKVHLPLLVHLNGRKFGAPNAGADMVFDFPRLIAHASMTRPLCAGTIIGSGTVSNKDRSAGSACLAEVRMMEKIETGTAKTPFMKFGDTVRIEMLDGTGKSVFGAIEQTVRPHDQESAGERAA